MNRILKWIRSIFSEPVPSFTETLNSEPSVVFEGEMVRQIESDNNHSGLTETYSEPGIIFVGDCQPSSKSVPDSQDRGQHQM